MDEDEIKATIETLQRQQSYQTNALRAALEARWSGGADTVDGWIKALDPSIETHPIEPLYEVDET